MAVLARGKSYGHLSHAHSRIPFFLTLQRTLVAIYHFFTTQVTTFG